jgi:glutamate 5-kinase
VSGTREAIAAARRLVVKVGSSALTTAGSGLDAVRLDALVDAIADRVAQDTQIVLVSSGAIGAGLAPLSLGKRPRDLATQQAAASVGQLALAHAYAESFGRY